MSKAERLSLAILLSLKLIIGVLAATAMPPWLGHEPDYFSVVRFLHEHGRLPERADFDGAARGADIAQATHPPLFTLAALPLVALLDDAAPVPPGRHPAVVCEGAAPTGYPYALTTAYNFPLGGAAAAGYSLRLLNLMFALGLTLVVYHTARMLVPASHTTALVAAAFAAFQPQVFGLGVFISGESLLLLISATNLFFAVRLVHRTTLHPADLAGLIITAILGPLTKTNGYVLVIGTGAVLAYLLLLHIVTSPRARTTRLLLAAAGILVLGLIALSLFNLAQYGSVIGRYQNLLNSAVNRISDFNWDKLVATLRDTNYDYTGDFPVQRQKVLWLYTLGGVAGLVLFVVSLAVVLVRRDRRQAAYVTLLVYALAAMALVFMRANLVNELTPDKIHTPLRYYVSGLPALAVIAALGWGALVPQRGVAWLADRAGILRPRARDVLNWNWPGLLWALVWGAVVVWMVADHLRALPGRHVYSEADFAALSSQHDLLLLPDYASLPADVPRVRAYDYRTDDGWLHVTAYMAVEETPTINYAARIVLADREGMTSACELIPQDGLYPVTRWEPDQVVAVRMALPNCAVSGDGDLRGPLDLRLEWLPADRAGTFRGDGSLRGPSLAIAADLAHARSCPSNLGVIQDTFQVIVYNGPTQTMAGDVFLPSVNWYVRAAIENADLARSYEMTHVASGERYSCAGVPRLGDYPISQWHRGETIYFDQCAIRLPADAPLGEYTLAIGLVDNQTGEYLPVAAHEGTATPEGLLTVAAIHVEGPH